MTCICKHRYIEHAIYDPAYPCNAEMCDCLKYTSELQKAMHDLWLEMVRLFRLNQMLDWLVGKLQR